MKVYKIKSGVILENQERFYHLNGDWDFLVNRNGLHQFLSEQVLSLQEVQNPEAILAHESLPPIGKQEVWAAGVTYLRSKDARMEESKESGGESFYDMVYNAERPELFFKATAERVVGSNDTLFIRRDSTWNTPEPELTLFINSAGSIEGYSIGNDMSSRSIEGENPLYLPQAKVYDRSAGLGPCLYVPGSPIPADTIIRMQISRDQREVYNDYLTISQMKRTHKELAAYLYKETSFTNGCYLMTGTCLVPPSEFTLEEGDQVQITIDVIGTLVNTIGKRK